MHVRCPHCQNEIEIVGYDELSDVTCPSCGNAFNLVPETESYAPATRRIGHFQLLEQLGAGGFGTVWKAKDSQLDRLVAVKIPRRDQVDSANVEMFLREARAAAQLKHPQIVAVHEVGREDGTLYIVSDFIKGVTLADRLTKGPLAPREAAELCGQIADALHHAHESGVIHRDLKPQNIMLDGDGRPHIMDFGLAKREASEITMTVDGKVLGTVLYMSPQQAKGESHEVDRRTDIYSLGVILFEVLTGERPFRGNRAMVLHQVLNDDPPSPRKLNSRISKDLETITLKCLEKDPGRRYSTAADVAGELRRYLRGEPIQARPITSIARVWRWSRRNPVVASLSGGVIALLFSFALVSLWAYSRAASDAEAKTKLAGEKSRLANDYRELANLEHNARQETERQLRVATAERLTAQALMVGRDNPVKAALLATAAVEATSLHHEPVRPAAVQVLHDTLALIGGCPLTGHAGPVTCLALSTDGLRLVTGSGDKTARVWDLSAADPVAGAKVLRGHEGPILCLALSPDGRRLVTGSYDHTVRVWDLAAADPAAGSQVLGGHSDRIGCLALSKDGRWLVTGSWDKTARVWDLQAADPAAGTKVLRGHANWINCVALSPDGRWLVTGSDDHTARVWDLAAADPAAGAKVLRGHETEITCLALSSDGRWLTTGGQDQTARVWDLAAADPAAGAKVLRGHEGTIVCLALSPDGRWLATGSTDNAVRIWDLEAADPAAGAKVLRGHDREIESLAFSPDGRWLVTGSWDNTARVWDLAAADPAAGAKVLREHEGFIRCLAFSPDGRWLTTPGGRFSACPMGGRGRSGGGWDDRRTSDAGSLNCLSSLGPTGLTDCSAR